MSDSLYFGRQRRRAEDEAGTRPHHHVPTPAHYTPFRKYVHSPLSVTVSIETIRSRAAKGCMAREQEGLRWYQPTWLTGSVHK